MPTLTCWFCHKDTGSAAEDWCRDSHCRSGKHCAICHRELTQGRAEFCEGEPACKETGQVRYRCLDCGTMSSARAAVEEVPMAGLERERRGVPPGWRPGDTLKPVHRGGGEWDSPDYHGGP